MSDGQELAASSCHLIRWLQVLVLENVRFYKEETKNDAEFAKKVSIVVQDANHVHQPQPA